MKILHVLEDFSSKNFGITAIVSQYIEFQSIENTVDILTVNEEVEIDEKNKMNVNKIYCLGNSIRFWRYSVNLRKICG